MENEGAHKYVSSYLIWTGHLKIQKVVPKFCSKYSMENKLRKHDSHNVRSFLESFLFLSSLTHSERISSAPFPVNKNLHSVFVNALYVVRSSSKVS